MDLSVVQTAPLVDADTCNSHAASELASVGR